MCLCYRVCMDGIKSILEVLSKADWEAKFWVGLVCLFLIIMPIFTTPITKIHCDKIKNNCEITQNFISISNHRLYDEDFPLISLQYRAKTERRSICLDYRLVASDSKNIFAKADTYVYDNNPFSASKFRESFSSFLKNDKQNQFNKLHIPIYYYGLLFVFLLLLLNRNEKYKIIFVLYIILASLVLDFVFTLINSLLHF